MAFMPSQLPEEERQAFFAELRQSVEEAQNKEEDKAHALEFADMQALSEMPYMLGDIEIPQLSHDALAILQHLRNPVVTGEGDVEAMDMYEFLLVLTTSESLSPKAYRHAMQLRLIKETQGIAEKSPDNYERYLGAIGNITERYFGGWEEEIKDFAKKLKEVGPEEITDLCRRIIEDASRMDAWAEMAKKELEKEAEEPKKKRSIWQRILHPFST